MGKKKKNQPEKDWANLRLNPEARLSPKFDSRCLAQFPTGKTDEMGFRVVDDCAEDHIQ